jgi:hypothetical protein
MDSDGRAIGGGPTLYACATEDNAPACRSRWLCDDDSDCSDGEVCRTRAVDGEVVRGCRASMSDAGN